MSFKHKMIAPKGKKSEEIFQKNSMHNVGLVFPEKALYLGM